MFSKSLSICKRLSSPHYSGKCIHYNYLEILANRCYVARIDLPPTHLSTKWQIFVPFALEVSHPKIYFFGMIGYEYADFELLDAYREIGAVRMNEHQCADTSLVVHHEPLG